MDKETFAKFIKKINIAYDNPACFKTGEGIELWYECFKDYKPEIFDSAVMYLIKNRKKIFTIAELNEVYNSMLYDKDEWQSV